MRRKETSAVLILVLFILCLVLFFGRDMTHLVGKQLYPRPYPELVSREAKEFRLEEALIYAVMKTESGFDPHARSHADATGLMQLTPATFQWVASLYPPENGGDDPEDPLDNIHCGCALLRHLLDHYESLEVALCAYNAGMGNVSAWLTGGQYSDDGKTLHTIPYPETGAYVKKVFRARDRYLALYEWEWVDFSLQQE